MLTTFHVADGGACQIYRDGKPTDQVTIRGGGLFDLAMHRLRADLANHPDLRGLPDDQIDRLARRMVRGWAE